MDDNVDAAEMMQALLQVEGDHLALAHSALDALHALDRSAAMVAFLDAVLPSMDGYEMAQRIRAMDAARALTLIALTGWGSGSDRQRAFENGFDHHLAKPIDTRTVYHLVQGLKDAP